ncbi:hypothetical protein HBI18_219360 [Parastagonospora nodorum]|nr:hypothetical protein HBH42_051320 [Parastagonospora nodorum]KAH4861705.1 hypothetical protein HBH75_028130 [Parastagonospora nodorum]KAH5050180.1 hypothetical protein HBH96_186940 [Parastagonospora nodorum]KAH5083653.1 hypothetical protein HBH95_038310 [Parastagonospora nodorum]KAH5116318.1 hypothetical protein HBH71_121270 [Parastagonospora nodorum]
MLPKYTQHTSTQQSPFPPTPTEAYFSDREATEAAKAKLEATIADLEAQITALKDPLHERSRKISGCFIVLVVSLFAVLYYLQCIRVGRGGVSLGVYYAGEVKR